MAGPAGTSGVADAQHGSSGGRVGVCGQSCSRFLPLCNFEKWGHQ